MITIDQYLKIGKMHEICEDYILSGLTPLPHVILSDGCSSSKNTDVAARLLCLIARKFLFSRYILFEKPEFGISHQFMGTTVITGANIIGRDLLYMDDEFSLDATLIVSYIHNEKICVHVYGDGNILATRNDGSIRLINIKTDKNFPYYLSYQLDKGRDDHYKKHAISTIITDTDFPGAFNSGLPSMDRFVFPISEYKTVLISSDGIESVNTDIKEITNMILDFKTFGKRFVARRLRWILKRFKTIHIYNQDDISIGGYHIEK